MSVQAMLHDAGDPWPVDDHSAACVVFSPPYNAGIEYADDPDGDQMAWDGYESIAVSVMKHAARALMEGGRCWVNVTPSVPFAVREAGWHSGQTQAERVSLIDIWMTAGSRAGLNFRDTIAWVTPGRGPGTAWGSYASPAGPNIRGEWEAILAFSYGPWGRKTPDRWKGWKDGEGGWPRLCSNVWTMQPESDRSDHPVPFPVELPSRCIRLSTFPDELVIDPYVGSGTTLLAAQALGRPALGFDRAPQYVDLANNRTNQGRLFGATNTDETCSPSAPAHGVKAEVRDA